MNASSPLPGPIFSEPLWTRKKATDMLIVRPSAATRPNKPITSSAEQTTSPNTARPRLTALPTPSGSGKLEAFSPNVSNLPRPWLRSKVSPSHSRSASKGRSVLSGTKSSRRIFKNVFTADLCCVFAREAIHNVRPATRSKHQTPSSKPQQIPTTKLQSAIFGQRTKQSGICVWFRAWCRVLGSWIFSVFGSWRLVLFLGSTIDATQIRRLLCLPGKPRIDPMPAPANERGQMLLAEEYFATENDRFVDALRTVRQPRALAAFADRWKKDPRPWARGQILLYLQHPLNSPGHQPVVKRLFKQAEVAGD